MIDIRPVGCGGYSFFYSVLFCRNSYESFDGNVQHLNIGNKVSIVAQ